MKEYLHRFGIPAFQVSDIAPSTVEGLHNCSTGILTIWGGASDNTIWGSAEDNYLFRAWHDSMHLKSGIDFSIPGEIQLAKIQREIASRTIGDQFAALVYAEIAGQAQYYAKFREFPVNQVKFIEHYLRTGKIGVKF